MTENFNEEKKHTVLFYWKDKGSENSCRLHDKTIAEAKKIATEFGWKETKWYNPTTWLNAYLVINYGNVK